MVKALKAQSAIEYLMTYGWMLLVVAIVGGAVFSITGEQTVESVSGFNGADLTVEDFGFTSNGELQLVLRNTGSESTSVNSVNLTENSRYSAWEGGLELGVGETGTLTLDNVTEGDGSSSLNLNVNYDQGTLEDMEIDGTISGSLKITEQASQTNGDDSNNNGGDGGGSSDALVSYYAMDEGTGTQALDSEGSNDADLKNGSFTCSGGECPRWVTGKQNQGINLDGSSDELIVSNPSGMDLSEFTISAWLKLDQDLDQQANSYPGIVSKRSGNEGFAFFLFDGGSDDYPAIQTSIGNGTTSETTDVNVSEYSWTTWQHVAITYDGSAAETYINGTSINTTDYPDLGSMQSADTSMTIGEVNDVTGNGMNGTIDEVKIWSQSLSDSEIQDEYNSY